MKKNRIIVLLSMIVCLVVIISGSIYYNSKVNSSVSASQKGYKDYLIEEGHKQKLAEEEQKQLEKEKEKERKEVYAKHKGEKLTYFPMGDSLAFGAFASSKESRYVGVLSNLLNKDMGYDVVLDDSTVKSSTGVKDNGLINLPKLIKANPDFVTIEFGTNEVNSKLAAYSNTIDFEKNLSKMIKEIQEKTDAKIVLVTTWNNGTQSYKFDSVISQVGEEFNVPVANTQDVWGNSDNYGPEGKKTPFGVSDNWHPNDKGHKEIAEKVFEKAYEVLK